MKKTTNTAGFATQNYTEEEELILRMAHANTVRATEALEAGDLSSYRLFTEMKEDLLSLIHPTHVSSASSKTLFHYISGDTHVMSSYTGRVTKTLPELKTTFADDDYSESSMPLLSDALCTDLYYYLNDDKDDSLYGGASESLTIFDMAEITGDTPHMVLEKMDSGDYEVMMCGNECRVPTTSIYPNLCRLCGKMEHNFDDDYMDEDEDDEDLYE